MLSRRAFLTGVAAAAVTATALPRPMTGFAHGGYIPAPPNWPHIPANPAQWNAFKAAGWDMRQFWLVKPIPASDDLIWKVPHA